MAIKGVIPSVTDAARSGEERDLLVALRENMSWMIDEGVHPRDLSALTRRIVEVTERINAIDAQAELERPLLEGRFRPAGALPDGDEAFDITAL